MNRFLTLIALTGIATLIWACGPPISRDVIELGGEDGFPWRLIETTLGYEHYEISIPDRRFDGPSDQDWFRLAVLPPYGPFSPEAPGCLPRLEVLYGAEQPFDLHISRTPSEELHPVMRERSFHDSHLVGDLPIDVTPEQPIWMRFTPASSAPTPDYDLTLRFTQPITVGARACSLFTPPL